MVNGNLLNTMKVRLLRAWTLSLALVIACAALLAAGPEPAHAEEAGSVVLSVIGVDDPAAEHPLGVTWVGSHEVAFEDGATAWDVFKPALDEAGLACDAQDSEFGVFIQSITSAEGLKLENTNSEPYSFWSFLVNGEAATTGVSGYELQDGDQVELVYYPNGEAPAVEPVPAEGEGAVMPIAEDAEATNPGSAPANTGAMLAVGGVVLVVAVLLVLYVVKSRKGKKA